MAGDVAGRAPRVLDAVFAQAVRIHRAAVQELFDQVGDRREMGFLLDEAVEVIEAFRVEQSQAREMAFPAKLFRRRGQQQHRIDARRELGDDAVLRADIVARPVQVMRLVDDQHVPAGVQRLL